MILKALYDYYHRSGNLAPQGMEYKEIAFLIVIDWDGKFVRIEDRRIDAKTSSKFLVLKGMRSGTTPKPYIYWDNVEYVLNYTKDHKELTPEQLKEADVVSKRDEIIAKANIKHDALVSKYREVSNHFPENREFKAVSLFLEGDELQKVYNDPLWGAIAKKPTVNISFLIQGELRIVAEHKDLGNLVSGDDITKDNADLNKICLITGDKLPLIETTTPTAIPGGQATARLVAFQINSGYDSYGKSKGLNAHMSNAAEACYTTALNKLLAKDSRNKFYIASRTFLFWASSKSEVSQNIEDSIFTLFGFSDTKDDNPNLGLEQVENALRSIYSGTLRSTSSDKFYFLGLAPNAARIAVVYWKETPIRDFAGSLLKHFEDMEILSNRKHKRPYKGLYNILSAVSLNGKISDCLPNLPESTIKSMLQGIPYTFSLYSACISRIRAEQNITITRAAIIKAYLNRLNDNNKKITIEMDTENRNQGYLCGRLFATLEYLQERASSGNTTIRSRYMCAASATPATVFATLLNLSNHHSDKLKKGAQVYFENIKSKIVADISADGFPTHLNIQDQGRFMVGYYHQREWFYTSKAEKEIDNNEE